MNQFITVTPIGTNTEIDINVRYIVALINDEDGCSIEIAGSDEYILVKQNKAKIRKLIAQARTF